MAASADNGNWQWWMASGWRAMAGWVGEPSVLQTLSSDFPQG